MLRSAPSHLTLAHLSICFALLLGFPPLAAAQAAEAPESVRPVNPQQQPEGLIHLDVTVTVPSGQPVMGLDRGALTLLDSGRPATILSFRSRPQEPVTIILFLDTLNTQSERGTNAAVEQFLTRNGGHLDHPVGVYALKDWEFGLVAQPSLDGNALASAMRHNRLDPLPLQRSLSGYNGTYFSEGVPDLAVNPPFAGLRALASIATSLRSMPGRKVLLWIGPGAGAGTGTLMLPEKHWVSNFRTAPAEGRVITGRQDIFDKICWLSLLLRTARIDLFTLSMGQNLPLPKGRLGLGWRDFLNGVPSEDQAHPMSLYKDVLAIESGGQALVADHLADQIAACILAGSNFYTLSFNPPMAAHPNEYHSLEVRLRDPGLTAYTSTGYYDQPWYADLPPPGSQNFTVAQLQKLLTGLRALSDAQTAQQLSLVHLTERLSAEQLGSLESMARGKRSREALQILAAPSAFLDPASSVIGADPPPNAVAQQQILASAAAYLDQIIPRLPNFFATRTMVEYGGRPAYDGGETRIDPVPLHMIEHSRGAVLYRHGEEIVDTRPHRGQSRFGSIQAYGTFGPLLGTVRATFQFPGALAWSHWERFAGVKAAVFRYEVPAAQSRFRIGGCCLPQGDGNQPFAAMPSYHGEMIIDPSSGALLRITLVNDLRNFVPEDRAEMMVSYGPVPIGDRTYILPLRSINLVRVRTVEYPSEWEQSFRTWGPYVTVITGFTFTDYHMFRSRIRILPGVMRTPAAPSER